MPVLQNDGKKINFRRCLPQIIAVMVKNILLLVYGMSIGMPTILIPRLSQGGNSTEMISVEDEEISWLGSLSYLCVPMGCLLSGVLTQPIGRKRSMQVISLLFLIAFLLFFVASKSWHVFLALSLSGFSGGLLEAPTLIYVVEITEPHMRGAMSSTSTLAIAFGVMISFILGAALAWRTMALINASVPIIGLIMMLIIPESPYWLIEMGRSEEARKSLAWLRGWLKMEEVNVEYNHICEELKNKTKEICSIQLYGKASFLKPYFLVCFTFILAHFGITPINIYAVKIFQLLQAPIDSYFATIFIGVVELAASVLLLFTVRRFGKRVLSFVSLLGISLSLIVTGIYSYRVGASSIDDINFINSDSARNFNWIPLITIISVGFFSYLMIYSLPWIIMGEIFPSQVRDSAAGFSAGTGYIIGFLANKTFLNMVNVVTLAGVLWIYSAVAILGIAVLYVWLPETEGKTLQEITDYFADRGRGEGENLPDKITGIVNRSYINEDDGNLNTKF